MFLLKVMIMRQETSRNITQETSFLLFCLIAEMQSKHPSPPSKWLLITHTHTDLNGDPLVTLGWAKPWAVLLVYVHLGHLGHLVLGGGA